MTKAKTEYQLGMEDKKNGKNKKDNPFASQLDMYNYIEWLKGFKSSI